jgi:hypothetical protein
LYHFPRISFSKIEEEEVESSEVIHPLYLGPKPN